MVVLHYTEMTLEGATARLCDPVARVSAHWLIAADGSLVQMVDEARRAWHAGVSHWDGATDINSRSIGIELDSPGHAPDAPTFPAEQVAALIALLDGVRSRWAIPASNVVAHSDVAPARKIDPGERFPWDRLARAGHCLPPPDDVVGDGPVDAHTLTAALRACGYGVAPDPDSAPLPIVVRALHRRFRPTRVEAPADVGTLTLARTVAAMTVADRYPSSALAG